MIQRILVVCLVAVTTDTGISGVTLILASRCGHSRLIAVIGYGDRIGLKSITTGAVSTLFTLCGAGSFLCHKPLTHVVTGSNGHLAAFQFFIAGGTVDITAVAIYHASGIDTID